MFIKFFILFNALILLVKLCFINKIDYDIVILYILKFSTEVK